MTTWMEEQARQYVQFTWRIGRRATEWERVDMAWFSGTRLISSAHHTMRAVGDARDPALGCRRIQSLEGHHRKFGPPFMCVLEGGRIVVAAHDVAFVARRSRRGLILITTLPRNTLVGTFNDFIKPRKAAQARRRRRPKRFPKKGTNINK